MYLHEMVEFNAREYPDVAAINCGSESLSFREFDTSVNQLAHGLRDLGLAPGSRIALLAKNNIHYLQVLFACLKTGVVLVPINFRLTAAELDFIIKDSEAKLLIVGDGELRATVESCPHADNIALKFSMTPTQDATSPWADIANLYAHDASPAISPTLAPDACALQLYTSGTTGNPKGVMIGQQQLLGIYLVTSHIPERMQVGHLGIMPLPLFHIAGLAASMMWLSHGATVDVIDNFDPVGLVQKITASDSCDIVLVPAMIQALLAFVPDIGSYDFTPLKRITYGASPISQPVLEQAIGVFGCDFVQGFGMTELGCMVLCLQAADHQRALTDKPALLRSCGRPLPGVAIKALREDGTEAAPGETGELCIKSPTTMTGYWRLPEKTQDALVDGWLKTGDAGYIDEEGFFYIRDRVKDMIVSGGENIYPAEIENVLFSHPAIQDVAVIGVPDKKFGEAGLAVCVLAPDSKAEPEELTAFCRNSLAGYKIPKQFEFVSDLPRNPSGKVLKRVLRAPYWEGCDSLVG